MHSTPLNNGAGLSQYIVLRAPNLNGNRTFSQETMETDKNEFEFDLGSRVRDIPRKIKSAISYKSSASCVMTTTFLQIDQ